MDLSKLFEEFPDFFNKIVKTTSEFGPLALGILLLLIVLFGIYQLKGTIATNRLTQFVGGIFVFVVASVLLFFIYQSFNFWLVRQKAQTIIFVQGTIDYQLPSTTGGDLYFDLQSVNAKNVSESRERFYAYDSENSITQKQVIAITKPDRIELTVSNRQVYQTCNEDSPKVGSRNRNNLTRYIITLNNAYLASGNTGPGVEQYWLGFEYKSHFGSPERDFLRMTGFKNIDPDKISFVVRHVPETCFDEEKPEKYAEIVKPKTVLNIPGLAPLPRVIESVGRALVSAAFGQKAEAPDTDQVVNLLGSTDFSLAAKAKSAISQRPDAYLPLIVDLLRRNESKDALAQVNLLVALKGAMPKAYKLPTSSIVDVIRLSYLATPEIRQAARNYLTDAAVLDDDLVKTATDFYNSEKAKAIDGPQRNLLLLITIRDIYYVEGINKLRDYVGDWGKRDRSADAIDKSEKNFQSGIDLIKDVPQSDVVPFAKSYYGMALAIRSRTAVNEATRVLGEKASFKQIDQQIYEQVSKGAALPFTNEERTKFISTLDGFLAIVNNRESDYLWPAHITKMKACRARQTYDCLHGE